MDESPSDSVHRQFLTIELSLCSLCINLLRFLTDHLEALPLAVVTRMLNTHGINSHDVRFQSIQVFPYYIRLFQILHDFVNKKVTIYSIIYRQIMNNSKGKHVFDNIPYSRLLINFIDLDVPVSLINVLEGQAFTRRDRNGLEKFSEARWSTVEGGEQLRLTKLEAQLWIALYNLIMTPLCRQKYRIDAFRKTQILRVSIAPSASIS